MREPRSDPRAFSKAYSARYTSVYEGARLEAINFRVRCAGPVPTLSLSGAAGGGDAAAKIKGTRKAWFEGGWSEATVYDRYALRSGDTVKGPAIIEARGDHDRAARRQRRTCPEPHHPCRPGQCGRDHHHRRHASGRGRAPIEADPISLEIMWSRMINVVEEMWLTVCRTAFSLVISEAQDFACELLDPEGETLAHSPRAMPVFNLTLPRAVKALLERYPAETLKPGDVLITNDPWLCAGHLFDIAIVTPVFGDRVVGLMGTVGHVSDIGGTKDSLRAREIYEEGFQIPPMKLYEAGRINETLVRLLGENVRNSEQVLGDLHSFVAANAIGAERLQSFMADYGMQDLRALAHVVQSRSEKGDARGDPRCRRHLSRHGLEQPLGTPMTYPLALTVKDDTIHLDFAGAPPQLPQGGLNCTLNYTMAHATYPLKCMLTPSVRGNAGCYRPFTVEAPKGSILNCDKPLAVNLRTRTGWYLAPNIFRALSEAQRRSRFRPSPACRWRRASAAATLPATPIRTCSSAAAARALGPGRRQVGPALPDLGREHLDRDLQIAGAGAGGREDLPHRFRRRRLQHRGGLGQRVRLRKLG
jgi:5-oxoprolinase (ATP-hydrolysing)/N-methylhydantoinase A